MEQLNLFNNVKILDDGFKYDYEGKFIGIDIKKFPFGGKMKRY